MATDELPSDVLPRPFDWHASTTSARKGSKGRFHCINDLRFSPRCDFVALGGVRLVERIRFNILEIQENFENFSDKKELSLECLDAVKAHQKLASLGEPLEDYPNIDTEQV